MCIFCLIIIFPVMKTVIIQDIMETIQDECSYMIQDIYKMDNTHKTRKMKIVNRYNKIDVDKFYDELYLRNIPRDEMIETKEYIQKLLKRNKTLYNACCEKDLEAIAYLYRKGQYIDLYCMKIFSLIGYTNCFEYVINKSFIKQIDIMIYNNPIGFYNCVSGNLENIKLFFKYGGGLTYEHIDALIRYGHLDCVKYLQETFYTISNMCENMVSATVLMECAIGGGKKMLKYINQHGGIPTSFLIVDIVEHCPDMTQQNKIECIKYLRKQIIPWHSDKLRCKAELIGYYEPCQSLVQRIELNMIKRGMIIRESRIGKYFERYGRKFIKYILGIICILFAMTFVIDLCFGRTVSKTYFILYMIGVIKYLFGTEGFLLHGLFMFMLILITEIVL